MLDLMAKQIGNKLALGNTNLNNLLIWLGPSMTVDGARQLALGLRHSSIDLLRFILGSFTGKLPGLQILVPQATISVQELRSLRFQLDDDAALMLGGALIGNTTLKSPRLNLHRRLTVSSALQLDKGIRHFTIVHLRIEGGVYSEVKRIMLKLAICKAQTLREVSLAYGMGTKNNSCRRLTRFFATGCNKLDAPFEKKLQLIFWF